MLVKGATGWYAIFCTYLSFPVADQEGSCCQLPYDPTRVLAGRGYLANSVTLDTGCSSGDCPWLLHALEGQRINISIYDFGIGK